MVWIFQKEIWLVILMKTYTTISRRLHLWRVVAAITKSSLKNQLTAWNFHIGILIEYCVLKNRCERFTTRLLENYWYYHETWSYKAIFNILVKNKCFEILARLLAKYLDKHLAPLQRVNSCYISRNRCTANIKSLFLLLELYIMKVLQHLK